MTDELAVQWLRGRVALVTGAGSGIGKVIAGRLARQGATTVFADLNGLAAQQAVQEHGAMQVEPAVFNVSSPEGWSRAIETIAAAHGRLDMLVNCAGAYLIAPADETSLEDWNRIIDSNLSGVFYSLKYAAPLMARGGEATIINIASTLGLRGRERMSAYAASKAGVISLTRSAAVEFARKGFGVRVNAICPGPTNTPIVSSLDPVKLAALGGVEALLERAKSSVPMGRLCLPDEIADAVLFLISDQARFITGACLTVDGGQSA